MEKIKPSYNFTETQFKTRRAEIIHRLTVGINRLRINTKYKPLTERLVAIKANRNPFLKNDTELDLVVKNCEAKGNYSHFFWLTK